MEPNKETLQQWIDALRSGKYKQGKEALRRIDDDGYCCLGIACDLYHKETGKGEWSAGLSRGSKSSWRYTFVINVPDPCTGEEYTYETAWLPEPVQEWLGLDNMNPMLQLEGGGQETSGQANDKLELTFDQIADAIERTFLTDKA